MREIAWGNDGGGMLLGARAHDARLISLEFMNRCLLRLIFKRVDGTEVELSYEGVQEISLRQIWDDSIVSDIFIWSVGNVPSSQSIDAGWNALFQGRAGPKDLNEDIRKIIDRDRSQFLSLIGFIHGASAAVVCKSLSITEA